VHEPAGGGRAIQLDEGEEIREAEEIRRHDVRQPVMTLLDPAGPDGHEERRDETERGRAQRPAIKMLRE
jgi:hypothetical protein